MSLDISNVRANMVKKYGSTKVPTMEDHGWLGFVPWGISTQSLCVDLAIGRPGIPGGRCSQILGLDASGKSTLAQHIIAEVQRIGGIAGLAECEGAYEDWRLRVIGAKPEQIFPLEPTNLEEVYGMGIDFITNVRKEYPSVPLLLVIDSLDGFHAEAAMNADPDESLPMVNARVNGVQNPKLCDAAARYKCALLYVSQLTTKVSTGFRARWAGPEYDTKGGLSLKYRASLRLSIKRRALSQEKDDVHDAPTSVINEIETIKNKVAPPFRKASYHLIFEKGIDKYADLWDAAQQIKFISAGAGRKSFKWKKKEYNLFEKEWPAFCDDHGGPDKIRDMLTKKAIKRGFMRAYGEENESLIAESEAEKETVTED